MPVAIIPLFRAAVAAKGVALVALSRYHSTNRTPSVSPYGLPAPPLGSRVSLAAPAGGSAAVAAKGVALVALSRYHPTNHTPSVRPFGLPAPPLGSRVSLAAPAGGSAATAAKGVALVTLSWWHSTNHTPSVSLCSTAPPLGSRVFFPFWKRR